jgi:hypothetical protein
MFGELCSRHHVNRITAFLHRHSSVYNPVEKGRAQRLLCFDEYRRFRWDVHQIHQSQQSGIRHSFTS